MGDGSILYNDLGGVDSLKCIYVWDFPGGPVVKNPPSNAGDAPSNAGDAGSVSD